MRRPAVDGFLVASHFFQFVLARSLQQQSRPRLDRLIAEGVVAEGLEFGLRVSHVVSL